MIIINKITIITMTHFYKHKSTHVLQVKKTVFVIIAFSLVLVWLADIWWNENDKA